jgi:hypothetical protein
VLAVLRVLAVAPALLALVLVVPQGLAFPSAVRVLPLRVLWQSTRRTTDKKRHPFRLPHHT